jgi:hypothetical protein
MVILLNKLKMCGALLRNNMLKKSYCPNPCIRVFVHVGRLTIGKIYA